MTIQVQELTRVQIDELWAKVSLGGVLYEEIAQRKLDIMKARKALRDQDAANTGIMGPIKSRNNQFMRQCLQCNVWFEDGVVYDHLTEVHNTTEHPLTEMSAENWQLLQDRAAPGILTAKLAAQIRENCRIIEHNREVVSHRMGTGVLFRYFAERSNPYSRTDRSHKCKLCGGPVVEGLRKHILANHLTHIAIEEPVNEGQVSSSYLEAL